MTKQASKAKQLHGIFKRRDHPRKRPGKRGSILGI